MKSSALASFMRGTLADFLDESGEFSIDLAKQRGVDHLLKTRHPTGHHAPNGSLSSSQDNRANSQRFSMSPYPQSGPDLDPDLDSDTDSDLDLDSDSDP